MSNYQDSTTFKEIRPVILNWMRNRLSEDQINWLETTGETLKNNPEDWELFTSFSAVPRHTGKKEMDLTGEELSKADTLRSRWNPSGWSADQFGRTYLILCYADHEKSVFFERLEKIFVTSDLGEAVALYQSLPLLPYPEDLKQRAAEGIRSNITTVFNAVALENPYPCDYMEEDPWNQIVLKALFVGSPLYKIIGLDSRANKTLAKILVEYAHERISAGRDVSPELWRPVGPFIDEEIAEDIEWVLDQPDALQKTAGILSLNSSSYSGKDELLQKHQKLVSQTSENDVTWDDIGKQYHANKRD